MRGRALISVSVLALVLVAPCAIAQDAASVAVLAKTRQDIDNRLNTLGVSSSLTTGIGRFDCEAGRLTGRSRIDSFNNIFGIGDVREAEWHRFRARDLGCRYGAKWSAAGGEFRAGFGVRDYAGDTVDEPGGKDISIEGAGALLAYAADTVDATLKWTREVHDYRYLNATSFGNYVSLVDSTEDSYVAVGNFAQLHLKATHVRGRAKKTMSTRRRCSRRTASITPTPMSPSAWHSSPSTMA